jgi:hypothetical protein
MHYVFISRYLTRWGVGVVRCDDDSTALINITNQIQENEKKFQFIYSAIWK